MQQIWKQPHKNSLLRRLETLVESSLCLRDVHELEMDDTIRMTDT